MAALTLPTTANYEVHENVSVDTLGTVLLNYIKVQHGIEMFCKRILNRFYLLFSPSFLL